MSDATPLLYDLPPSQWNFGDHPEYRRKQVAEWVFRHKETDLNKMKNLPASLRVDLAARFHLEALTLVRQQGSEDTTRKFLFSTRDGDFIECVLIPASPALYGERSDRYTLCVSSQVGCAYACAFCASGLDGWKRNLTPGEILAQVIQVERLTGERVNNLVFMGMGEPFANYPNLMSALEMIHADWGLNIGARHITVSTSGLVPLIQKFADQPRPFRLAVSLHGASDAVRNRIMPINKKYPLATLFEACRYFNSKKKQKITFEYILIEGINDSPEEARRLVRSASALNAKVNLIPYNRVEGLDWRRPEEDVIHHFHDLLSEGGIQATVRLEKGHDIDAACGQLRLREKLSPTGS
ncbi:MAG: 23S rRNA (adenine(2503)-C(2))-methyltransferase RlmN [Candidatus Methylacidiphilales bacterium]